MISDERLREIVADGPSRSWGWMEFKAMAAELLAARAELAAMRADRDAALLILPACCGSLADAADTLRQDRDEARAEFAAEKERHAITARKLAECEANRVGALGLYGKIEGEQFELRKELKVARADAESARREGQEIAAGLHEKLAELRAENERLAKQRDEARGVVARVVEIIDGSDGGVPASAADVWNLCDKWRHQWVMEAKAIAAEQTKAAPCFSDLPVYEEPKPAGGGA